MQLAHTQSNCIYLHELFIVWIAVFYVEWPQTIARFTKLKTNAGNSREMCAFDEVPFNIRVIEIIKNAGLIAFSNGPTIFHGMKWVNLKRNEQKK